MPFVTVRFAWRRARGRRAMTELPAVDVTTEWDSDVVLTDGSIVHVRPLRPDDEARMV